MINIKILLEETEFLLSHHTENSFFENFNNYDKLIETIIWHNHLYYIDNKPIITDTEYDRLFAILKTYESYHPEHIRDDSPTQRLIEQYEIQNNFKKSNHQLPILSLQNTYNTNDIIDRYESITRILRKKIEISDQHTHLSWEIEQLTFSLEPKYDGLSIVLTYEQGKLVKAVTRGDGYTGDDVTININTIKNLTKIISEKERVIVRWEVMMPKSVFKKINNTREQNWEDVFSNTRNAAAGSLKLLNANEVSKRWLLIYIYDILQWPKAIIQEFQNLNTLINHTAQGFFLNDIINIIQTNKIKETLLNADVDFDGLVIKLNNHVLRNLLWETNHHPRRAIAYKFPAQQIATKIEHIERQVWRTGILTPVAHLTPTNLSGVTISRVSLHNRDFITSKHIHINDRVRLQRSGEVIPYIISVINQRRNGNEIPLNLNHIYCPSCNTKAEKKENIVGTKTNPSITTQLICPNADCPGILKEKLKHFVSKNAMNIASIGDATLEILINQKIIQSLSDLYTLTNPETLFILKRFPGIWEKKVDTFIEEIEASKYNSFWRFLNALWINGIGIKLAKEIEKYLWYRPTPLRTIEQFFAVITTREFLTSIYGVGEKLIIEIQERYSHKKNKDLLNNFAQYGIIPQLPTQENIWKIQEKTICITGTFPITRSELEYYIKQAGFHFTWNITKTTDYLLVGTNSGSKKDKAWPNTKVITNIQEIYSLLNISAPLFDEKKEIEWNEWKMQSLFW